MNYYVKTKDYLSNQKVAFKKLKLKRNIFCEETTFDETGDIALTFDFNKHSDSTSASGVKQYVGINCDNEVQIHTSDEKSKSSVTVNTEQCLQLNKVKSSIHFDEIKLERENLLTLDAALNLLYTSDVLKWLDESLDKVKRCMSDNKHVTYHLEICKDIDKKLQKQSLIHHPDKVKSTGGSDEEIKRAKEKQILLNAVRITLQTLTEVFLNNLDVEYEYKFYAKMNINLLGNEDQIKKQCLEILHKILCLSDIKQEKIIRNIHKFLKASQCTVKNFIEKESGFERNLKTATLHLNMCVEGYDKLIEELGKIKADAALKFMQPSLDRMDTKYKEIRKDLNDVQRFVMDYGLNKIKIKLFNFKLKTHYDDGSIPIVDYPDEYFVLPFMMYINLLHICNILYHHSKGKLENKYNLEPILNEQFQKLYENSAYLLLYLNGNKQLKKKVGSILGKNEFKMEDVEKTVMDEIKNLKDYLQKKFNPKAYIAGGTKNYVRKECSNLSIALDEILKKEKKDILNRWQEIDEFRNENDKIKEQNKKIISEIQRFRQEMFQKKCKIEYD